METVVLPVMYGYRIFLSTFVYGTDDTYGIHATQYNPEII
jgi:hypothetical protein